MVDLSPGLVITRRRTGQSVHMQVTKPMAPCVEFSRFAARVGARSPEALQDTLKFLQDGRRGFLLALPPGVEAVILEPGDLVAIADGGAG
jgi:hypothetical protein